jgi:hypothetical protein
MAVSFLVFEGTSILISIVAALTSFLASSLPCHPGRDAIRKKALLLAFLVLSENGILPFLFVATLLNPS